MPDAAKAHRQALRLLRAEAEREAARTAAQAREARIVEIEPSARSA